MSGTCGTPGEILPELVLEKPDYKEAELDPSPNFGPRRDGKQPVFLILHYTGLATAKEAMDVLKSPEMEVSAHYVVHEDGRVVQMVSDTCRHATVVYLQKKAPILIVVSETENFFRFGNCQKHFSGVY